MAKRQWLLLGVLGAIVGAIVKAVRGRREERDDAQRWERGRREGRD